MSYLMQQPTLLDRHHTHTVVSDGVHAVFEEMGDESYDVTLDINSQKFLIHMTTTADKIEQFEIRVAKSFYDVTQRVVHLLKKIVLQLWHKITLA
jgi:hypothetical protein